MASTVVCFARAAHPCERVIVFAMRFLCAEEDWGAAFEWISLALQVEMFWRHACNICAGAPVLAARMMLSNQAFWRSVYHGIPCQKPLARGSKQGS